MSMDSAKIQPLNFDALTRKSPLGPDRYLLTALKSGNAYQVVSLYALCMI